MATDWSEMNATFVRETEGGEFTPTAHYDADVDALTFFISNEPEQGKRLNSRVTISLSDQSEELVGCRVKGVASVLEDIGSFDVSVSHRTVKFTMLFAALHGQFSSEPEGRAFYRRLGKYVSQAEFDLELPQAA